MAQTDPEGSLDGAETQDSAADVLAPRVRVQYPDGGEVLPARSRVTIAWTSGDDRGVVSHRVQLSLDGGKTHQDICPALPGDTQRLEWEVPQTPCDKARIRVIARDAAGNLGMDRSHGCFTIAEAAPDRRPPEVALLAPAPGTELQGGQEVEVRWRSRDEAGVAAHRIWLSLDGGASWNPVARRLGGAAESYLWTVPRVASARAQLRVEAYDPSDNRGAATSAVFAIRVAAGDDPPWEVG